MANNGQSIKENKDSLSQTLTLAIWSLPLDALAIHFSGWTQFFSSLSAMKANASPPEFWAALQFWSLGAFSHPLMDAAFGISEVLHASPGPMLAGLVPYSFLLATTLLAIALAQWDKLRAMAVSTSLALLLAHVGTGLDSSSLADYNLQLDDDYQGKIVQGCPAPEAVQSTDIRRQSFDYLKYQGRWYWHKVHDWTQFHQMYDTTLDIQLTPTGYINTLTVKGPSPTSSPLSWDKSPLLEGIRYSWKGVIDPNAGSGMSIESGFGVSFPNYIIDATEGDNKGDQYQELVQFQCIQVGGIRLYEGVDFMSRSSTMTNEQLEAMHERVALLNPYGASPEQMHRIEQKQHQSQVASNEWQRLWNTLGIEKYLDQSLKE
jgi:hypothetical protein